MGDISVISNLNEYERKLNIICGNEITMSSPKPIDVTMRTHML
jgi:hypothetical protein